MVTAAVVLESRSPPERGFLHPGKEREIGQGVPGRSRLGGR